MKILHFSDLHGDLESLKKFREYAERKNDLELVLCSGDLLGQCLGVEKAEYMQEALGFIGNSVKIPEGTTFKEVLRTLQFDPKAPNELREAAKFYSDAENEFDKNAEEQYSKMLGEIEKFPQEFLMIPGNWDSNKFYEIFEKYNIHCKEKNINDTKIAGFGGAGVVPLLIPPTRIIQYSETGLYEFLTSIDPDIAITHIPQYTKEIGAEREGGIGSFANLAYLKEKSPGLLLCGHYHGLIGSNEDDPKTLVIHPGNLGKYGDSEKYGTFAEIERTDKEDIVDYKNINDF